jgi:PAS domain S-box-containing protein
MTTQPSCLHLRERLRSILDTWGVELTADDLLDSLLAHHSDLIAALDQSGKLLFANRPAGSRSMDEFVGMPVVQVLDRRHAQAVQDCLVRAITSGASESYEVEVATADGRLAAWTGRLMPVHRDTRLVAFLLAATDVSADRRRQHALRDSEEKMRLAVEASGIALFDWDPRRDVAHWDERLQALTGLPATGRMADYVTCIHPDDRPRFLEHVKQVLNDRATGNRTLPQHEVRLVAADGSVRPVLNTGTVFFDSTGEPERVRGGLLDVSELYAIREQLRRLQKLDALGRLTAGVAHNFNNLLMGILPNVELSLHHIDPRIADPLRDARDAVLRAADLAGKLTRFAGGRPSASRRDEELDKLVQRTVAICRATFPEEIALTCETLVVPPPLPLCSSDVEQVLLNVLINARDALEGVASPWIGVVIDTLPGSAVPPGTRHALRRTYARIRVVDNGCGMTSVALDRVFEPFFTTKEVGRGIGLGMATSYAIIAEHAGWITYESEVSVGTTCTICLPCAGAEDEAGEARAAQVRPASPT